jgi:hypothetical protein
MEHYSLTYRLNNRKLTSVAGISLSDNSCLRQAERAFNIEGYITRGAHAVAFTKNLETQKNYTGKSPLYREL